MNIKTLEIIWLFLHTRKETPLENMPVLPYPVKKVCVNALSYYLHAMCQNRPHNKHEMRLPMLKACGNRDNKNFKTNALNIGGRISTLLCNGI